MTSNARLALKVETRGIEPIPDSERRGGPIGLFWLWFASSIGIIGLTYGFVLITFMGLNLVQAVVAVILGAGLSALFLGFLSTAGVRGGAPGLTLSRAVFGPRGNLGPTIVSWLGFVGWETVMCTTATYALVQILALVGVEANPVVLTICIIFVVAIAATIGLIGHAAILFLQKWLTWVFGGFTLVVIAFLLPDVQWDLVYTLPAAPLVTVIGGIGFIAAGTGLGWLSAGADFARYLPRATKSSKVVAATALGCLIPITVLVAVGGLMAVGDPTLATASDPVTAIGSALPSWLLLPYLITAFVGLITAADLSMYSSGLNFVTAGIPIRRTTAVAVDAVLITIGALYITLVAEDFFGPFTAFLTLLAVPLTAWAVVFGVDMLTRKKYDAEALLDVSPTSAYWYSRGTNWPAWLSWMAGVVVGVSMATVTIAGEDVYVGPLAGTWFGQNGLAWLGAGLTSMVAFGLYSILSPRRETAATQEDGALAS